MAKGAKRKDIDLAEVRRLYDEGISLQAMGAHFGVSRGCIANRLRDLGLRIRNGHEAMKIRMARMTPEERQELSRAAHAAVRGMRRGSRELVDRARQVMEKAKLSGPEREVMAALTAAGLEVVPLYALHKYNFDLGIPAARVGIEVHNTWHTEARKARQDALKLECALGMDWQVLYVNLEHLTDGIVEDIKVMCENRIARYTGRYLHRRR
jgi:hypothetical protein